MQIDKDNDAILTRWQGKVYVYSLACPHQNTALKWSDEREAVRVPQAPFAIHARRHLHQGQRARDARPRSDGRPQGRQQRRRQSRQGVSGRRGRSRVEDRVRHRLTPTILSAILTMSCEDCVNRRDFLAKSALAAAALVVLDGCGDGQIGPLAPSSSSASGTVTINVADFPGLATVGTVVDIAGERALVRTSDHRPSSACRASARTRAASLTFATTASSVRATARFSPTTVPWCAVRTSRARRSRRSTQLAATFDPVAGTVSLWRRSHARRFALSE